MPYTIYQSKGKWCLRHRETGETKGCHASREMAIAEQRVLNQAGYKDGKKS